MLEGVKQNCIAPAVTKYKRGQNLFAFSCLLHKAQNTEIVLDRDMCAKNINLNNS